jgi:predicted AlkP superfamily pyrophosphatase or phosphodiesterase
MRKAIVFSADAMVYEDTAYFKTLPNYKKYLAGGAEIKKIRSIYPTVTYPVHVSLATGAWPDRHGVVSNMELHPGVPEQPWTWFHDHVKIGDIFDEARKKGLSTAGVFWPVTGRHPSIDYLIPEYWTQMEGETLREAFTRGGSNPQMLQLIEKNFRKGMVQRVHPGYDEFIVSNACDIIREFKPGLLMIHVANIDDYRHKNGVFNDRVAKGIEETDEWIGRVMAAAEDAGVAEETTLFLVSDHGQIDITRSLNVNVLFADYGLIRADEEGRLVSWDAYSLSNGLSALVYLRDREDHRLYEKTYALLRYLCEEGIYGIGRVFTEPEARASEHLGGDFSFVLETDGYTSFGDNWKRPIVKNMDLSDYRYGKATHGYLPDRGPQPMFMAKGPGIRPGAVLEKRDIIDEAPTFAKVLGFSLPEADGVPIDEILL